MSLGPAGGPHVPHVARAGRRTGRLEPGQRNGLHAWPQAVDAAEAGRDAHRADQVRAVLEEGQAGGECGRGPAAGAARGARRVPRAAGHAVPVVRRLPEVGEHEVHVRLPDDHRAGLPQPVHHGGVRVGQVVLERRVAPGGVQPGDVEALLDRDRHAEQRRPGARGHRPVRLGGLPQRRLGAQLDHRVQPGVDGGDPGQQQLGQLPGGDLPAAEQVRRIARGPEQRLAHRSTSPGRVAGSPKAGNRPASNVVNSATAPPSTRSRSSLNAR